MNIALLHYSYPPQIGGVESVVKQHARLFADHGHNVTVFTGSGFSDDSRIRLVKLPMLEIENPDTRAMEEELRTGVPGAAFDKQVSAFIAAMTPYLKQCDIFFAHNVLSMPFNLACTAALWELTKNFPAIRWHGWIHDFAVLNPDYIFPYPGRFPWNLLSSFSPDIHYICVSKHRAQQFRELAPSSIPCRYIPNAIDPLEQLPLTPNVKQFVTSHHIMERDVILFHPTRFLKRKNIEFGLHVTAALKTLGKTCAYLLTAAADPHQPSSVAYADSLKTMAGELNLQNDFFFLNDHFAVEDADIPALYAISDALFFPSTQEGFGIPLLEAALHRIPVFCFNIEPLRSLLPYACVMKTDEPPENAAQIIVNTLDASPLFENRKFLIRQHSLHSFYSIHLEPLLT